MWLDNDMSNTAANTIKTGDRIVYRGQVREVLNARTFGGRTDIRLAGINNRYDSICPQFAADQMVEVR